MKRIVSCAAGVQPNENTSVYHEDTFTRFREHEAPSALIEATSVLSCERNPARGCVLLVFVKSCLPVRNPAQGKTESITAVPCVLSARLLLPGGGAGRRGGLSWRGVGVVGRSAKRRRSSFPRARAPHDSQTQHSRLHCARSHRT